MKQILCSIIAAAALVSCKKSDTARSNTNTASAASFTWSENGGATITADSAYYTEQFKTIMAWKNGAVKVEINLAAGTPATYSLSTAPNALSVISSGAVYTASAGTVTISSNASSKMSGSFTSTGSGASLTTATGSFANIPVR